MKKVFFLSIVLGMCMLASITEAAVFNVTPSSDSDCSDFDCDLQSALNTAATNGQNDTIHVAAGVYRLPATLSYVPSPASAENFSLTIIGAGATTTIIDCGQNSPAVAFDTTVLPQGSQTAIAIEQLTINGRGSVRIGSQSSITLAGTFSAASVTLQGTGVLVEGSITATGSVSLGTAPTSASGLTISAGGCISLSGYSCGSGPTVPSQVIISPTPSQIVPSWSLILTRETTRISALYGETVTLDATLELTDGDTNLGWRQVSGPLVTLSDPMSLKPTFVLPVLDGNGAVLQFEHAKVTGFGAKVVSPITVTAAANGITGFPTAVVTFKSATNDNIGMKVSNGALTKLVPVVPATLTATDNRPAHLPYDLFDIQVKVAKPGDTATVTVYLPAPAPAGATWFKYSARRGWYDFSDHAVFSENRTEVTLTLVDGGIGDDDGIANGTITDPSGLASGVKASAPATEGGSSGCFIATAAYGSYLHPFVRLLRTFRDEVLLPSSAGRSFVEWYYRVSPPIAQRIARNGMLAAGVRVILLPAVGLAFLCLKLGVVSGVLMFVVLGAAMVAGARMALRKRSPVTQ